MILSKPPSMEVILDSPMLNILHLSVISFAMLWQRGEYCIMFDALKVLIIAPIKSRNDIVEATFYESCQLPAMQELEIIVTCKYHAPNHIVKLKYAMSTICINGYVKYKLSPVFSI